MLILDTNVLSEVMKPEPAVAVSAWVNQQNPLRLFTTSITVSEIYYGLALMPPGKRQEQLRNVVRLMFEEDFYDRILVFDHAAAIVYGEVTASLRRKGKPMAQADAQIAAIATTHQAPLVTRNITDFENWGVELINPWLLGDSPAQI